MKMLSADNSNQKIAFDIVKWFIWNIILLENTHSYFWHDFYCSFSMFFLFLEVKDFKLKFAFFKELFWDNFCVKKNRPCTNNSWKISWTNFPMTFASPCTRNQTTFWTLFNSSCTWHVKAYYFALSRLVKKNFE